METGGGPAVGKTHRGPRCRNASASSPYERASADCWIRLSGRQSSSPPPSTPGWPVGGQSRNVVAARCRLERESGGGRDRGRLAGADGVDDLGSMPCRYSEVVPRSVCWLCG